MIRSLFAFCFVLSASAVFAQQPNIDVRKFTLYPTAPTKPALRYALLPEVRDLMPGNAALSYQRAHSPDLISPLMKSTKFNAPEIDWFEVSLDKFPRAEAEKIASFQGVVRELEIGARRDSCQWELTDRLAREGMTMLLPDVQSFRSLGVVLMIRGRLALLDRNFDQAHRNIQTGLAMSEHVAQGPTLIHNFVGQAMVNLQIKVIEDWIQTPGAPNLYWPLSDLPRPFLPLRRNLQSEKVLVDQMFPEVRAALANPKQLPITLASITNMMQRMEPLDSALPRNMIHGAWVAMKAYPQAKALLMEKGRTAEQVEALGMPQAVVMAMVARNDEIFDEMAKWVSLPYWQAQPRLADLNKNLHNAKKDAPEINLLASLLLPSVDKMAFTQANALRRLEMLRCIEAIRNHAAQRDSKLPANLDDIRDMPIPVDPITGRAFAYRLEDQTATLTGPAQGHAREVRYEIRLGSKKSN